MNKFQTCEKIVLLSYADNNTCDEKFASLYNCYRLKLQISTVFDLGKMNSADYKA